ncbi:hypothetical protein BGZ76_005208, partial [Entomortierella beljakovae]
MEDEGMEATNKDSVKEVVEQQSIVDTVRSDSAFQRKQSNFIVRFADPTLSPPPRSPLRPSTPRPKFSRLDALDSPSWRSRLGIFEDTSSDCNSGDEIGSYSSTDDSLFLDSANPFNRYLINKVDENEGTTKPTEDTRISGMQYDPKLDTSKAILEDNQNSTISQSMQFPLVSLEVSQGHCSSKGQSLLSENTSPSLGLQWKFNITPPTTPGGDKTRPYLPSLKMSNDISIFPYPPPLLPVVPSTSNAERRRGLPPSRIPRYRHRIPSRNVVASKFTGPPPRVRDIKKLSTLPTLSLSVNSQQSIQEVETVSLSIQPVTPKGLNIEQRSKDIKHEITP